MKTEERIRKTLAKRPLRRKELATKLKIPKQDYPTFRRLLKSMLSDGKVYKVKGNRYALPGKINVVVGRLDMTKSRGGYLVPEEKGADVYIPPENLSSAFHGDKIAVRVEGKDRRGAPSGSVIKILARSKDTFVGVFVKGPNFDYVIPDEERVHTEFYIPKDETKGARSQEKVVVEIIDWGTGKVPPTAKIVEVLGDEDKPGFDVLLIVKRYNLQTGFPYEVEEEARNISKLISEDAFQPRKDFRKLRTFTIDPVDAKDFDDALSIERLDSGNFQVGIHIADVSYYVSEGSEIDLEARKRGTSVYLVDRVVPMLPELLSTDLCSLKPEMDKLTLSVVLELDRKANLIKHSFEETIICSNHRLTYEEVQGMFDGDVQLRRKYANVYEDLMFLRSLSEELTAKRRRRGSIDFDLPESRVVLSEDGWPEDIQKVVRLDSHRLIEEFMLLANMIVAQHLNDLKVPFISRTHEEPDEAKLINMRRFLAAFGINLSIKQGVSDPKVFGNILEKVKGKTEETVISNVILRSMKQARYVSESTGHFALALPNYTHFTSPIRRYPDLVVHRILREVMRSVRFKRERKIQLKEQLPEIAQLSSERERIAVEAERDSINMKKVEFMERHLGDEFEATISGVKSYGFFAQLDKYFVEGLVHVNSLADDYYSFVEEKFALVGGNKGRIFRLGDRVRIQVAKVDKEQRKIDFFLKEKL